MLENESNSIKTQINGINQESCLENEFKKSKPFDKYFDRM